MDGELRLNKYLSDAGVCSRREADRQIETGNVTIDGLTAALGAKVLPGQKVMYGGKAVGLQDKPILIAFHKPAGIVCTTDRREPDNIIDFIGYESRIYPVGRLDKDSEGLILLTNDGALMEQILKSRNGHEKEYDVMINKPITEEMIDGMEAGIPIQLEDRGRAAKGGGWKDKRRTVTTKPCHITKLEDKVFRIILTQGLNRQIRKMCEAFDCRVLRLRRIRIMNIELGKLKLGTWRNVTPEEKEKLMEMIQEGRD